MRGEERNPNQRVASGAGMTSQEDIANVAGQLADLTRTVEEMANQLRELQKNSASQQEHSDAQQDRIEVAARELAEVSTRLQAAASVLKRES